MAVVPVSVFVSETTVPSALRASIVSVCVVSPAFDESASTVSPAVDLREVGPPERVDRAADRRTVDVRLGRGVVEDEVRCDDRRH
jgi:hypothetical protein